MRVTKATVAGQRYLDLQREAKRSGRPTDELVQLYALECFLDRLEHSRFKEKFVLKGGVLLAALGARRPTRDIDFSACAMPNDEAEVLPVAQAIASINLDDGLTFDASGAHAETIREGGSYKGVRVTLSGKLSRAEIRLHVDINFGDPIWPSAKQTRLPRLLGGTLGIRGYPLEMVLAEKLITVVERGSTNTRWRDFVAVYVLAHKHSVDGVMLRQSIQKVAEHRDVKLSSLIPTLTGYADLAQSRWSVWLRKQNLGEIVPTDFQIMLDSLSSLPSR